MKTIIRGRDSGKAKELLKYAREHDAAVITQNKRALRVKADSLGFKDVEIIDYDDLIHDNYHLLTPVVVHNADKMLYWLISRDYGLETLGFTATESNEE